MPTRIQVTAGVDEGLAASVDEPVILVGRDSACAVRLSSQELDDVTLAIELSDKEFIVHNKSSRSIRIGTNDVPPAGSRTIRSGKEIILADGTGMTVTREKSSDGSAAKNLDSLREVFTSPPLGEQEDEGPQDTDSDADEEPIGKLIAQIVGIVIGLVLLSLMVLSMLLGRTDSEPENIPTLAEVVISIKAGERQNLKSANLVSDLQTAEGAFQRGDTDSARMMFEAIRNALLRDGGYDFLTPEQRETIEAFVRNRVAKSH